MSAWSEHKGQLLRLKMPNHKTIRGSNKNCALCAVHEEGYLRPRSYAKCNTCLVHLCTVPREFETEGSCFEYWHSTRKVKRRKHRSPGFKEQEKVLKKMMRKRTTSSL